jgi:catechol 2,3-dioxygenase-like lactoylglutathione lyase family enzyme
MGIPIDRIDHVVLNVRNVEASAAWYERVLGMRREHIVSRAGPRVSLRFGNQKINLRPMTADRVGWFTGTHPAPGSGDLCFITRASPAEVLSHFKALRVAVVEGPVERIGAMGEMTSIYCRDPDGNLIEVATYGER